MLFQKSRQINNLLAFWMNCTPKVLCLTFGVQFRRNSDGFFCIVDGGVIYLSCPREDLRIIDLPGTR